MMKRNILAVVIPALLVAGAANAAEIYNKDGNKLDLYGKVVGKHIWDKSGGDGNSADDSYARLGFKGETQVNDQLTGFGQWEYNLNASGAEGSQDTRTRLAFAGLKAGDYGSFSYGRNYGVFYDALASTDMLVEYGGDTLCQTDNFMTCRTTGVATYRNTNLFGLVEGLALGLQYQGKNVGDHGVERQNGDGASYSLGYDFLDGFNVTAAYTNSDRTDGQEIDGKGKRAEGWATSAKYDANNVYAAVMYGESSNMTRENDDQFANKTQNIEAVVQYQFDFGLRPSVGYVQSKGKDLAARTTFNGGDADLVKYVEVGTWYYFNKNMNVYGAYRFNLLDENNYTRDVKLATDDTYVLGLVYQF
ncbi:porin [Lelliottia amnigena]|jgi:outer membrane pore protein F|uniref:porin n=1 Tax=Lelliottia amnigena TaxID=61646 RepID=UPI002354A6BB|nr:porin [Lelliottia amnigena]